MNKSHKVVVVTGASQGIGAAIVKVFRNLDYRIVATFCTSTAGKAPAIELRLH